MELQSAKNSRGSTFHGTAIRRSARKAWTWASDHGVSEALYLRDPDENGVELYWDRPQEEWPRTPQGELAMFIRRLDLNGLLKEVEPGASAPKVEEGPRDL